MTWGDKIRAMTDEELAGFCANTLPYAPWCDYDKENGWCELESCEPCALKWLKQEASDET